MPASSPDPPILLARLELLASQYRQLKRVGIVALVLVVVLLVIFAVGILKAQGGGRPKDFVLRDDNGKRRAWLGMDQGTPKFEFYDENENPLAGLTMAKDEYGFVLQDENQKVRGMVGMVKGRPAFILLDDNGKRRAYLSDAGNTVGLVLADDNEQPRAGLTVDKTGPHLDLKDEKGKVLFTKP